MCAARSGTEVLEAHEASWWRLSERRARLGTLEAKRIDSVQIQTGNRLVEMPWRTSQELRGRLLASGLDSLEDEFAAKGTSAPVMLDATDKESLLAALKRVGIDTSFAERLA